MSENRALVKGSLSLVDQPIATIILRKPGMTRVSSFLCSWAQGSLCVRGNSTRTKGSVRGSWEAHGGWYAAFRDYH